MIATINRTIVFEALTMAAIAAFVLVFTVQILPALVD
jgi:hypothetical protein